MAQNLIAMVMTLKGQGHRSFKINDTVRFFDLQNMDLTTKTVILGALVQKLWLKHIFAK